MEIVVVCEASLASRQSVICPTLSCILADHCIQVLDISLKEYQPQRWLATLGLCRHTGSPNQTSDDRDVDNPHLNF